MTKIQQLIMECMEICQYYEDSEIKSTELSEDGLSIRYTLIDRQIKVSFDEGLELYKIELWKLDEFSQPIKTEKKKNERISSGLLFCLLAYLYDADFEDLNFQPVVENAN